jgi:hypothetical protein
MSYSRREWLKAASLSAASLLLVRSHVAQAAAPIPITVYKTPTCGCCKEWVKHLQANGFSPKVVDLDDLSDTKASLGVPAELQSCHTGVISRYFLEGHVPADLVKKIVAEKPANILGLAVPGMPVGSPGMEVGGRRDPFEVIAWTRDRKRTVYAKR